MDSTFRKLNVKDIFSLREYRRTHTRVETAEKYNVSTQWVSHCMKLSSADILSSLASDKESNEVKEAFNKYSIKVIPDDGDRLLITFNKGKFKGLTARASTYYLVESSFEPSFGILVDSSKRKYLKDALESSGLTVESIRRVSSEDLGLYTKYEAKVRYQGYYKTLSWHELWKYTK